jgi:hypothetical protein
MQKENRKKERKSPLVKSVAKDFLRDFFKHVSWTGWCGSSDRVPS